MKKLGYFEKFIKSNEKSALSFALICPGVAFFVFGMFFIKFFREKFFFRRKIFNEYKNGI